MIYIRAAWAALFLLGITVIGGRMGGTSHFCETEIEPIPYKQRVNNFGYLQLYLILHVFIDEEFLMSFLKQRLYLLTYTFFMVYCIHKNR